MLGLTQSFSFRFSRRFSSSVGSAAALQIAPGATAAYSLRSLTGGNPKVVRVRRASDNGERDFTSSEITSGEMVNWVNQQVIAPLDIQALEADGRTGDFLIAKAAYSLRSLGTRQATVTSSGDTDGDTSGKYVVQVRRSSDDKIKSFTANQVGTSGSSELEDFCDEATPARNRTGGAKYSTFSTDGVTGFSAVCSAAAACGYDIFGASSTAVQVSFDVVLNSGSVSVQLRPEFETGSAVSNSVIIDSSGSKSFTLTSTAEFKALLFISGATNFVISNFSVNVPYNHSAFVKTWYDQSVTNEAGDTATGNHAVQATAGSQPKIVNAGALVADNGIDLDGSQFLQVDSVSGMGATVSMITASVHDSGGGGCVSLASSASGVTNFGIIEGNSVTNVNSRNTTSATASASVSGVTRLSFALTTGRTSTKAGALGGTLVESTGDYGDDFTSGELDRIIIGKLRASSGTLFDGRIREAIIYDTDQSDNRTAIEANIGEVYGISGIPAYEDTVNGFVETWYDQSSSAVTNYDPYPTIVDTNFNHAGVVFTKADEKTFTLVASNSTATRWINLITVNNGIRTGKHRMEFDLVLNSGSISSGFAWNHTDNDDDPHTGNGYGSSNYPTVGHNSFDFEIFNDGVSPNPHVFFQIVAGSTFDISVTNFEVSYGTETVVLNGNDATQATAGSQPKVVDAGVIVTRNGDAAIMSTVDNIMTFTLDSLSADGQQSVFAVLENDITSQDGYPEMFGITSTTSDAAHGSNGANRRPYWMTTPSGALYFTVDSHGGYNTTSRERHLYSHVMNDTAGGTSTVHQDGTQVDTRSITLDANQTFQSGNVLRVSANPTGALYMSEVIYYPSDQTDNRTALEANIANHYNITLV